MTNTFRNSLLALTFAAVTQVGHASTVGYNTDPAGPLWDRGDADTAYAFWDNFSSYTFSGAAAESSDGFDSAALSQSRTLTGVFGLDQGAGVYTNVDNTSLTGTDAFYGGNRGGIWTIQLETSFTVEGLTLQIKRPGGADLNGFGNAIMPVVNGLYAATGYWTTGGTDNTGSSNGNYSVTTYFWGYALANADLTNLTITFNSPTHRGVDFIAVDAGPQTIPEPSSTALLAAGLGFVALRLRRKSAKA